MSPPSPPGDRCDPPDSSNPSDSPDPPNEESGSDGSNPGTEDDENSGEADDAEVLLSLPDDLRGEFKEPFGPVFTDARELLAESEGLLVAIGDVVTYHLTDAGRVPNVAVLDGYTERTPVEETVREGTSSEVYDERVEATNPAATLTTEVLVALADALPEPGTADDADEAESIEGGGHGDSGPGSTVIDVDGEEDLLTLPAIVAAPDGTSVVYGQPGEGMVRVPVDDGTRSRARGLVERMDGDHERAWELLGVPTG